MEVQPLFSPFSQYVSTLFAWPESYITVMNTDNDTNCILIDTLMIAKILKRYAAASSCIKAGVVVAQ